MSKNKKKLTWIICLCVVVATILIALILGGAFKDNDNNKGDTYDTNIRIINESYPTDIILLGKDINFSKELKYRKVNSVTPSMFNTNKPYQLIIINDLDGNVNLTDEDWLFIKSNTIDGTCDFYYLGTDKLSKLKELGFYNYERNPNDLCLGVAQYYGVKSTFNGIWTTEENERFSNDSEQLGMLLVMQFARVIKSNH